MGRRVMGRKRLGVAMGAAALLASGVYASAPAGAAFPGINGKIACASNRDGNFEIYTFNPNGTELEATRLTNNPASDGRPRYRSDGRMIAFESTRSGASEIWIMNADGSNPRQLTFSGGNSSPSWHPDGSQIAYQSVRNGRFQISKINIDGTGETQLTFTNDENSLPAWSPDGTIIAFSSRHIDPSADVETMTPFGTNVVDISNNPGVEDSWPAWSPSGDQIAFHSRRDDPAGEEIYRMNPNGTGVVRLTNNVNANSSLSFDIFPFYSPDGARIGWNSGRDGSFGEVYTMSSADGSDVRRITNNPATDQRCDWQPLCTIYGSGDITGTPGDDVICGSEGPDRISGGGGNDVIYGFGGDDQISGGDGNDRLFGGTGNDFITGGAGADFISGGPGNDRLVADPGERMDPGAGTDACSIGAVLVCPPRLS